MTQTNYAAQGTQRALEFERMVQDCSAAEMLQSPLVQDEPKAPRRKLTWADVRAFVFVLALMAGAVWMFWQWTAPGGWLR